MTKTRTSKFLLKLLLLIILISSFLFFANYVLAANPAPQAQITLEVPIFEYEKAVGLAEYIKKLYQYSLYALVPIAIVVVIWAGFLWIMAGGNQASIKRAKTYITGALTGVIIGLLSYVILSLVGITELKTPDIEYIAPIEVIPPQVYQEITRQTIQPTGDYYKMADEVSQKNGLKPCYLKVVLDMESGGRPNVVGHDENANNKTAKSGGVPARREFLKSGVTSKGASFSRGPYSPGQNCSSCGNCQYCSSQKNDDEPTCGQEDLCLDWRWSHGIGLCQFTISGKVASTGLGAWCKGNIPSRSQGGRCFTAKELFDPQTSLERAANMFRGKSDPYSAFKAYNGSDDYAVAATKKFQSCCSQRGGC